MYCWYLHYIIIIFFHSISHVERTITSAKVGKFYLKYFFSEKSEHTQRKIGFQSREGKCSNRNLKEIDL